MLLLVPAAAAASTSHLAFFSSWNLTSSGCTVLALFSGSSACSTGQEQDMEHAGMRTCRI
jgi:hypothetical protein